MSQERERPWQGLWSQLSRLQNPSDVWAACLVAFAILAFEAAVCPLIIANIPCESLLSPFIVCTQ